MEALLVVATWLFAVTHVDTFVVLVAFCTDEHYHPPEVLVGHYLGFGFGLVVSLLAAALAAELLHEWAFLLGFVPIGIGIRGFRQRQLEAITVNRPQPPGRAERAGVVTAAGIGLSGENVAVFVPFFATLSSTDLAVVVVTYLIAAGVLFVVAFTVARRTIVAELPGWIDRWIVPTVLVVVGVYVLAAGWFVG